PPPDPLRVLPAARQLLESQGTVVLSVPNVAHADVRLALLKGTFPYRPYGLLDQTHLRFFTRESITNLLADAGFVATEVQRMIVPAFTSELKLDRGDFPPAVVDLVLADPEAEVYQFVVRAVLDTGDVAVTELAATTRRLEQELWAARIRHELDRSDAATELQDTTAQLREAMAELNAIKNGKLMRSTAPFRRMYRRFRPAP